VLRLRQGSELGLTLPGPGSASPFDAEGFLLRLDDWDEALAQRLAGAAGISLTPAHWEIIYLVRRFYAQYKLAPAMRPLVQFARRQLGPEKGQSLYLMQLFPGGSAKLVCKIAGLPKPDNCL